MEAPPRKKKKMRRKIKRPENMQRKLNSSIEENT